MPDGSSTAHLYKPKLATVLNEGYSAAAFHKDLAAALTVAVVALPLSMAIAVASGVGPERGLYSAVVGGFLVSALGGILWGNLLGVDVNLALVGFKVFPVVILGGLDSIPGAILGGLIVGVVENIAAGYVDPYVGGGTKDFAPYVLMILALMIRPYGIFGKRIIERV